MEIKKYYNICTNRKKKKKKKWWQHRLSYSDTILFNSISGTNNAEITFFHTLHWKFYRVIFLNVFVHLGEAHEVHSCNFFDVSTVARDATEIGCRSSIAYTFQFGKRIERLLGFVRASEFPVKLLQLLLCSKTERYRARQKLRHWFASRARRQTLLRQLLPFYQCNHYRRRRRTTFAR